MRLYKMAADCHSPAAAVPGQPILMSPGLPLVHVWCLTPLGRATWTSVRCAYKWARALCVQVGACALPSSSPEGTLSVELEEEMPPLTKSRSRYSLELVCSSAERRGEHSRKQDSGEASGRVPGGPWGT